MNFLNLGLALGAAAFLIPLLIHIFNRSRFRVVQWGAMHLLESVLRVNRKQVQLEQIILLIIRCAIPHSARTLFGSHGGDRLGAFIHRILLPLSRSGISHHGRPFSQVRKDFRPPYPRSACSMGSPENSA